MLAVCMGLVGGGAVCLLVPPPPVVPSCPPVECPARCSFEDCLRRESEYCPLPAQVAVLWCTDGRP